MYKVRGVKKTISKMLPAMAIGTFSLHPSLLVPHMIKNANHNEQQYLWANNNNKTWPILRNFHGTFPDCCSAAKVAAKTNKKIA